MEASLRIPLRGPDPHKLSPRIPEQPRRAAVAVLLWGDAEGARKLVLVQRGYTAPHHPGELAFPGGMVEAGDRDLRATASQFKILLDHMSAGYALCSVIPGPGGAVADGRLTQCNRAFTRLLAPGDGPAEAAYRALAAIARLAPEGI